MAVRQLSRWPQARREMTPPGSPVAAPEDLGWEHAIRLFLEAWGADHPGIRPHTLEHYREQLHSRIAAFAAERGIAHVGDLTRYDLRAFVGWLETFSTQHDKLLTPRGKQMALDTARRFLFWLYQEQLVSHDLSGCVAKYRLDKDPEPRATPAADLARLLAVLDLTTPTGIRNAAMIQAMAFCGLRVAELVGLNADDLSLGEGRVRVRAEISKGRRARSVDLPLTIEDGQEVVRPEVVELLESWLEVREAICPDLGETGALFVTIGSNRWRPRLRATAGKGPDARPPGKRMTTDAVRTILHRIAVEAGVDPSIATPHRLRHYFGLSSAMAGVPTTALMRAMGHRSPVMTARYSEFADAERRWAFARADITRGLDLPKAEPPKPEAAAAASPDPADLT
jgi:integrase/recombinase XerD